MKLRSYGQIRATLLLVLVFTGLTMWGLLLTYKLLGDVSLDPFSVIITTLGLLFLWLMFVIWLVPYAAGNVVRASEETRYTTCILSPSGSALRSTYCLPEERYVVDITKQEVAIHIDSYPHEVYCENVAFALDVGVSVQLFITAHAAARKPHDIVRAYGLRAANLKEVLAFSAQGALDTALKQIDQELLAKQITDAATLRERLLDLLHDQPKEAFESGVDFEWAAL